MKKIITFALISMASLLTAGGDMAKGLSDAANATTQAVSETAAPSTGTSSTAPATPSTTTPSSGMPAVESTQGQGSSTADTTDDSFGNTGSDSLAGELDADLAADQADGDMDFAE